MILIDLISALLDFLAGILGAVFMVIGAWMAVRLIRSWRDPNISRAKVIAVIVLLFAAALYLHKIWLDHVLEGMVKVAMCPEFPIVV
jgi:hypothetical protein